MAGRIASPGAGRLPQVRLRLPERVPDFGPRSLFLFRLLWFAALLLAIAGPVAGTWYRLSDASRNSALVAGSRAGLALADEDLTRIRYAVGPETAGAGVRAGDDIVAIDTIPVSDVVPMPGTPAAASRPPSETDEALFGDLMYGEDREVLLRLRGPDGRERDHAVRTGERHIESGARALGLPGGLLSFADLLHLLTYPFLIASAWLLYRRKKYDVVSSVVSLAILLTLGTEQPSAGFLALVAGVPEGVHRALYDLGNVCLIGGILLFPHGRLRPRGALLLIALLPLLFLLRGDLYRTVFMLFMAAGVGTLIWRLRTAVGDERQQLKWAVFGFTGYALFLAVSLVADMMKLESGGLGAQLGLEVVAGFSFGLAFLLLQLGLLVALLRYRLYDAEVVISRSASFALIAIILGAVFAATMEGVKEVVLAAFGRDAGSTAPIVGAAISTILVNPAYEHVQRWAEGRFHRKLVELRRGLPDCLRDLRHVATLAELVDEVLARVGAGVRATRLALLIEGEPAGLRNVTGEEVIAWLGRTALDADCGSPVETGDSFFPLRLPLRLEGGRCLGWILLGPHPDRSRLSTAEIRTLEEIAEPVARALRLVLAREAREREFSEILAAQGRRIEALEARLSIDRTGTAA